MPSTAVSDASKRRRFCANLVVKMIREFRLAMASTLWLVVLVLGVRAATAACVGDRNNNGSVTASELTKVISIINLCDEMATGCAAIPGADKQCTNADRNANGVIAAGELYAHYLEHHKSSVSAGAAALSGGPSL